MYQLVMIVHVFAAISLVALVLVQQGRGATIGAAFGSGASQTVFGSRGSGSFLMRMTFGFMVVFFSTSIFLNHMASVASRTEKQLVLPALPATTSTTSVPATEVTPNSIPTPAPVTQPANK
jgi:preprotein translocase subunit SecG